MDWLDMRNHLVYILSSFLTTKHAKKIGWLEKFCWMIQGLKTTLFLLCPFSRKSTVLIHFQYKTFQNWAQTLWATLLVTLLLVEIQTPKVIILSSWIIYTPCHYHWKVKQSAAERDGDIIAAKL